MKDEMPSSSIELARFENLTRDGLLKVILGLVAVAEEQQAKVRSVRLGSPYDPQYIYSAKESGKRCQGCGSVVTVGQDIGWAPASKNIWHFGCVEPGTVLEDRRTDDRNRIIR